MNDEWKPTQVGETWAWWKIDDTWCLYYNEFHVSSPIKWYLIIPTFAGLKDSLTYLPANWEMA